MYIYIAVIVFDVLYSFSSPSKIYTGASSARGCTGMSAYTSSSYVSTNLSVSVTSPITALSSSCLLNKSKTFVLYLFLQLTAFFLAFLKASFHMGKFQVLLLELDQVLNVNHYHLLAAISDEDEVKPAAPISCIPTSSSKVLLLMLLPLAFCLQMDLQFVLKVFYFHFPQ